MYHLQSLLICARSIRTSASWSFRIIVGYYAQWTHWSQYNFGIQVLSSFKSLLLVWLVYPPLNLRSCRPSSIKHPHRHCFEFQNANQWCFGMITCLWCQRQQALRANLYRRCGWSNGRILGPLCPIFAALSYFHCSRACNNSQTPHQSSHYAHLWILPWSV